MCPIFYTWSIISLAWHYGLCLVSRFAYFYVHTFSTRATKAKGPSTNLTSCCHWNHCTFHKSTVVVFCCCCLYGLVERTNHLSPPLKCWGYPLLYCLCCKPLTRAGSQNWFTEEKETKNLVLAGHFFWWCWIITDAVAIVVIIYVYVCFATVLFFGGSLGWLGAAVSPGELPAASAQQHRLHCRPAGWTVFSQDSVSFLPSFSRLWFIALSVCSETPLPGAPENPSKSGCKRLLFWFYDHPKHQAKIGLGPLENCCYIVTLNINQKLGFGEMLLYRHPKQQANVVLEVCSFMMSLNVRSFSVTMTATNCLAIPHWVSNLLRFTFFFSPAPFSLPLFTARSLTFAPVTVTKRTLFSATATAQCAVDTWTTLLTLCHTHTAPTPDSSAPSAGTPWTSTTPLWCFPMETYMDSAWVVVLGQSSFFLWDESGGVHFSSQ